MGAGYVKCGIIREGSSGNYVYSVLPDKGIQGQPGYANYANYPVNFVSWLDAARFCNWLQNGQPVGDQGLGITETGSYALNGATTVSDIISITRNPTATYFLPSEDEWYKAAYYKGNGTSAGYWLYPTRTNAVPNNVLSDTGTNNANFYSSSYTDPVNCLTPVGAFSASPGPYGTYDQGGNVYQWNETSIMNSYREICGGSYIDGSSDLASSTRLYEYPTTEADIFGFRIAGVPEPGGIVLLSIGAMSLLVYAWRRHKVG